MKTNQKLIGVTNGKKYAAGVARRATSRGTATLPTRKSAVGKRTPKRARKWSIQRTTKQTSRQCQN